MTETLRRMPAETNRDITDYLRGLGISAVLITHYFGEHSPDFYSRYMSNYSNAFMAIFFILAGYGAFHSFEKRFSAKDANLRVMGRYFLDRVLRLYPLYWLALIISAILEPPFFQIANLSAGQIVTVILAIPYVSSPFWFIPSIIQCYIFAPFLYLFFKKIKCRKYIFFNLAFIAVLLLISKDYPSLLGRLQNRISFTFPDPTVVLYRNIFLGNVLLFSLGLMMPELIRIYGERMKSWVVFFISFFSMIVLSYMLRYNVLVLQRDQLLLETGYYSSIFFFAWSTIVVEPHLPMKRLVGLLGRHSYSLYIFHPLWFQVLILVELFQRRLPISLTIVLALFPLFLWFCVLSERRSGLLRKRFWEFSRRRSGPETEEKLVTP